MSFNSGDIPQKKASEPNPQPGDISSSGWFVRFLNIVERLGNLLPHPITLFALFCVAVVII
ncbi:MAG: AbgT family transporter, partial [Shewanella oncorhynchi]